MQAILSARPCLHHRSVLPLGCEARKIPRCALAKRQAAFVPERRCTGSEFASRIAGRVRHGLALWLAAQALCAGTSMPVSGLSSQADRRAGR